MAEYNIIQSLSRAFEKLYDLIEKIGEEIVSLIRPISYLPEMFEQLNKSIQKGFADQLHAMVEIEMASRQASIAARGGLAEKERLKLEEKRHQLQEDTKRIEQRYTNIQEQLDQEAIRRVRELDGHALNLLEEDFAQFIRDRYALSAMPALEMLQGHLSETYALRTDALEQILEQVISKIDEILDDRQNFRNSIENIVHSKIWDEIKNVNIPFWVVESCTQEKGTQKIIWGPGKPDFYDFENISYIENSWINELKNLLEENIKNELFQMENWGNAKRLNSFSHFEQMWQELQALGMEESTLSKFEKKILHDELSRFLDRCHFQTIL